jgi:hypothetical protein
MVVSRFVRFSSQFGITEVVHLEAVFNKKAILREGAPIELSIHRVVLK